MAAFLMIRRLVRFRNIVTRRGKGEGDQDGYKFKDDSSHLLKVEVEGVIAEVKIKDVVYSGLEYAPLINGNRTISNVSHEFLD